MRGKSVSQGAIMSPQLWEHTILAMDKLGESVLKNLLANVQALPEELSQALRRIRELDKEFQGINGQIQAMRLRIAKGTVSEQEYQSYSMLKQRGNQLLDDKWAIAVQCYDWIDTHVSALDHELEQFERDVKTLFIEFPEKDQPITAEFVSRRTCRSPVLGSTDYWDTSCARIEEAAKTAVVFASEEEIAAIPNEPLYCSCRRVSFGDMVACDNEECQYEWFHYPCVGLTMSPRGKWYCPDCRKDPRFQSERKRRRSRV